MEKFLKRSSTSLDLSSIESSSKKPFVEFDTVNLPADPGLRPPIWSYDVNHRDEYRRAYLQKGPTQPRNHDFPYTLFGKEKRRFNPGLYNDHSTWLEYSVEKDAVFCLFCYLFKPESNKGGGDSFVGVGFQNWKKKEKISIHEGKYNSVHNESRQKCYDLMNQNQSISSVLSSQTVKEKSNYRILLNAAIDCVRFLLKQGLPFRGHNESEESENQGNYLGLFHFLAEHNEEVKNISFSYASQNLQLTSPTVQKDICRAAAVETINAILNDLGDSCFSILLDESRDISTKEQMAVALRYVDKNGRVIERFLGLRHVSTTNAVSLKTSLEDLLVKHKLSISKIRGQGYDGASNMRGEFNGLKTLILRDNPCAFYVHCFAHQLQLALVAVAKKHFEVKSLFEFVSRIINTSSASCKRSDALKAIQHEKVLQELRSGELLSGRGLNQETNLQRSGDTRWSSHYTTLISLRHMYSSVLEVLDIIMEDGVNDPQTVEASVLIQVMQSFDFVFSMHVMINILGVTNELSQSLQRKNQDIENAMRLVGVAKHRLQLMRGENDVWDSLMNDISLFCIKLGIDIPNMDESFKTRGRPKKNIEEKTNLYHYRVELFYTILDLQLIELNDRFSEASSELLLCLVALNPSDSFSSFNKEKLIRFAQLYPIDFSTMDILLLDNQLQTYIVDMRKNDEFSSLRGINDLAEKMVATRNNFVYPLVYKLITLALTLPVATATVERAFSAMKIVKKRLRNQMGDEWLNDCLVTYIEKEVFAEISNEVIMQYYQNMKTRRLQL